MKILLVNDDGYNRCGLPVLMEELERAGHEVWVSAPSSNRSAQSHSMNLSIPIEFTKFGENKYYCTGTPADCILYAIKGKLFPTCPDLVISGINQGPNCSNDIVYSGTCGAAREAVFQKIPAMALSMGRPRVSGGGYDYVPCARWTVENLDRLMELTSLDSFVNINFPNPFASSIELGSIGYVIYPDRPDRKKTGMEALMMNLNDSDDFDIDMRGRGRGDMQIIHDGSISISVIRSLPALDEELMEKAGKLFS